MHAFNPRAPGPVRLGPGLSTEGALTPDIALFKLNSFIVSEGEVTLVSEVGTREVGNRG